jgi:hypothetical protein
MHKVHVNQVYECDLATVFNAISDHESFLSGGGLKCILLEEGKHNRNGDGAVRKVISKKLTFIESIFEFEKNMRYCYLIQSTEPSYPLKHKKGWLDFTEKDGRTRVDWHSHFEITIPIIGGVIGWFVGKQLAKVFQTRLDFTKKDLKTN